MDVLGMRGYEIVKDERGDPVKIGTLFMGEIPREWAERRQLHWANESRNALAEQEASFYEAAEREIRSEGGRGLGASLLKRGEDMNRDPAINDLYDGDTRSTGVQIGR
jgi:hypothetical protein